MAFISVIDRDGQRGLIDESHLADRLHSVAVVLPTQEKVLIPKNLLVRREDGSFHLPHSLREIYQQTAETRMHPIAPPVETVEAEGEVVLPVVEEEVAVGKRWVETGKVQVRKVAHEEARTVEETLQREVVDVERVTLNQVLSEPAQPRQEGDTLVIPVMEEMLVVEKRLVLKEEIRLTKRRESIPSQQTVTVRKEEAVIERLDSNGTPRVE